MMADFIEPVFRQVVDQCHVGFLGGGLGLWHAIALDTLRAGAFFAHLILAESCMGAITVGDVGAVLAHAQVALVLVGFEAERGNTGACVGAVAEWLIGGATAAAEVVGFTGFEVGFMRFDIGDDRLGHGDSWLALRAGILRSCQRWRGSQRFAQDGIGSARDSTLAAPKEAARVEARPC